ncbi:hypothetical protein MMC12_003029 [Toensbergia leucococca]|nr:hypothetical protein [Toensbergia leucococca]
MLITPRTYQQLQIAEQEFRTTGKFLHEPASGWQLSPHAIRRAQSMLLIHQVGSVRIGEVVRYTLTYTPSNDRILPSPSFLYVKIKNSSAIPLRAAYLHGPYTLYAACYPSTFDPHYKHQSPWQDGTPQFEPNLKAGGSWNARLTVPENIRETAGKANVKRTTDGRVPSFTWIIEISSQVIFSTSATVHFEVLVGRDENSIELGFSALTGVSQVVPGQLQDHQMGKRSRDGHSAAQPKGVYSKAVTLTVDDTASLWNKPGLPKWDHDGKDKVKRREHMNSRGDHAHSFASDSTMQTASNEKSTDKPKAKRRKKIHLVVLTHGLHSNLGADMLYLKESIDATAKIARQEKLSKRAKQNGRDQTKSQDGQSEADSDNIGKTESEQATSTAPLSGGQEDLDGGADDDSEDEQVIVRGFSGNAVRTERGIQYLGKRLAKYVLSMTYPDQPFLPVKKSVGKKISRALTGQEPSDPKDGLPTDQPANMHNTLYRSVKKPEYPAYKVTSISFIAHSLGGLTQMYAIAYIHKHSPHFFEEIKPINFVAMASPFLGLSNENPIYVKFALDFGLVGRTGQDLGLTWRAPTMVRSGWGAMIGGIGSEGQRAHRQGDPGSKPLLRVLPTGPAFQVLKMFRNRTVYSNVVNDGIVPLRTSCLLFLDWRGLGRVDKARRENGLVGTMAGWGWAELTGANSTAHRSHLQKRDHGVGLHGDESSDDEASVSNQPEQAIVPQPTEDATRKDTATEQAEADEAEEFQNGHAQRFQDEDYDGKSSKDRSPAQPTHPLSGFLSFLRPKQTKSKSKSHNHSPKHTKIYKRGQTINDMGGDGASQSSESTLERGSTPPTKRSGMARGDSFIEDPDNLFAPPKTTFFESAGDILNPPLPTLEFLVDPQSRPRTIFHDRIYHPDDIPAPPPAPIKRRTGLTRSFSSEAREGISRSDTDYEHHGGNSPNTGGMKVEEKIARAYHRDLSWRKVLVRLEPDAHNNMVVRRMFANAYGWPVIKHLVDTHFADTYAATTADTLEPSEERAKPMEEGVDEHGEEVKSQLQMQHERTESEMHEAKDGVSDLISAKDSSLNSSKSRPMLSREDSALWDDALFDVTDDDEDIDSPYGTRHHHSSSKHGPSLDTDMKKGTSEAEIAEFLSRSPAPMQEDEDRKQREQLHSARPVSSGNTTSVGLGKSVEEQLASPGRTRRASGENEEGRWGVSEDLARMSMGKGH